MTGPATPGQEGPSYGPPPLPEGWIAQWDGMSRKYYFVQLSTGASQWETPTHPAPTGPTPQATPQGVEHPYGTPGDTGDMTGEVIDNADGTRSVRYSDGRVESFSADGERGLGSFAIQQLLGGGRKQNQGGLGNLGELASQFLSSGSSHNNQSSGGGSGASGIVGALAGQLLGAGKKHDQQQSYTGSQNTQQQSQGGLMGGLGGMFGSHSSGGSGSQGGGFGYSSHDNQQGGYAASAPPTSYQPSGTGHPSYNPPPPKPYAPQSNPPSQSYGTPDHSYGQSSNPQPPYGASSNQPAYGATPSSQQQSYNSQQSSQQPPYGGGGGQQPAYSSPYGGTQHQSSYGSGHPPSQSQQYPPPPQSQQYPPPPSYEQGGFGSYGPSPSQPGNYAEMSGGLYSGGPPNVPMESRPHHGQQYQSQQPPGQGYPGAGDYGGQQGRW